jgi:hypothetical protein
MRLFHQPLQLSNGQAQVQGDEYRLHARQGVDEKDKFRTVGQQHSHTFTCGNSRLCKLPRQTGDLLIQTGEIPLLFSPDKGYSAR